MRYAAALETAGSTSCLYRSGSAFGTSPRRRDPTVGRYLMARSPILSASLRRLVPRLLHMSRDTAPHDAFDRQEWNDRRDDDDGPPQDTKPVRGQRPELIGEVEQPGRPDACRKDDGNDEAPERHGEEAIGRVSRHPQAWEKAHHKDSRDESFVEPDLEGREVPAAREASRDAIECDQPTYPVKSQVAGYDPNVERRKRRADADDAVGDQYAGGHGRNVLVNERSGDDCEHQEPWVSRGSRGQRPGGEGKVHEHGEAHTIMPEDWTTVPSTLSLNKVPTDVRPSHPS